MCVCALEQLTTHASAEDQDYIETPVELTIKVIDQNDNKPFCTQNPFMGEVLERAKQGRMWRLFYPSQKYLSITKHLFLRRQNNIKYFVLYRCVYRTSDGRGPG